VSSPVRGETREDAMNSELKRCFVIGPIGEEGSATRKRADNILNHVITPAAGVCGYDLPTRADLMPRPGIITREIIQRLQEDELVVADLAEKDPRVFYELAVRHAVGKPVVIIYHLGDDLPFDVEAMRAIPLDHTDLGSADACRRELIERIKASEHDTGTVDSPISQTVALAPLEKSEEPVQLAIAVMLRKIEEIHTMVGR